LARNNKTVFWVTCRSLPRFRSRRCWNQIRACGHPRSGYGILIGIDAGLPHLVRLRKLSKTSKNELEAILKDANARLQLVPPGTDASRAVTLMRFGPFEIRVFQPLSALPTNATIFWMELYDHDRQLSIDSIGDCTVNDAVIAAEDYIARARALNENPNAWRRPV
jgi:hypothetical protein